MLNCLDHKAILVRDGQLPAAKHSNFRAHAGPIAPVKRQEFRRRMIIQLIQTAPDNLMAGFAYGKEIALADEKTQLVRNIETSQLRIELDAIDYDRFGKQINVFGPQITMPVEDATCRDPRVKKLRSNRERLQLGSMYASNHGR